MKGVKQINTVREKMNPGERLYIIGYVIYEDAFGKRHHSHFCYYLEWKNGKGKRPGWMIYSAYNDSD
ncbi:MAG: hypothetical protein WCC11_05265, partial [Gammaproteobacteria bacterium]